MIAPLAISALWMWLAPVTSIAHAECNEFESVQSVVLAEGAYQPLPAQIEIARVAVTHGACNLDSHFYSTFGVAQRIATNDPSRCIAVMPCQAFYMLYTISPDVRESAAVAAYVALTESPRIARYHFNSADAPLYWWWSSPIACPSGYFIVGDMRFC